MFWCISVLLYLYSSLWGISGYVFPLGLAGCLILYLINPFPILHHSSRMWLLKVLVSTVFWCISVLLYLYSSLWDISGYVFPLGLARCLILYLINPFPILHHSSRMWLLKVLVSTVFWCISVLLYVGHIRLCVPSGSSWVSDTVPYQSIPITTPQQQDVAT